MALTPENTRFLTAWMESKNINEVYDKVKGDFLTAKGETRKKENVILSIKTRQKQLQDHLGIDLPPRTWRGRKTELPDVGEAKALLDKLGYVEPPAK